MWKFCLSVLFMLGMSNVLLAQDSAIKNTRDSAVIIQHINDSITLAVKEAEAISAQKLQDSIAAEEKRKALLLQEWVDTTFANHIQTNVIAYPDAPITYTIEQGRQKPDYIFHFCIILITIFLIGLFKFINPSYFKNTFIAFRKPNLSQRSLKEQLSQNSLASLAMDLLSCVSIGTFIYSIVYYFHIDIEILSFNNYLLYISIILGTSLYFLIKFSLLKLHGFIFNIEEEVNNYAYNISLINKVLGVILIPFTALILLNNQGWVQALIFISSFITLVLISNTYLRSNSLFKYFLQHNRFHFFLYLCTSELIPIVLIYTIIRNYTSL